jgi:hypothetical protein
VLIRLTLQPITKVRMGDSDERFGAFGDGLSLEIDHAIFGDDIHDVGARRGHDIALLLRAPLASTTWPPVRRPSALCAAPRDGRASVIRRVTMISLSGFRQKNQ